MDVASRRIDLARLRQFQPLGIRTSIVTIACCGAAYGAALGAWNGGRLAAYAAAKLPIVLLATTSVTLVFNAAAAGVVIGRRARLRDVAAVTLSGMAVASMLLASLAPVILLFDVSLPPAGAGSRTTHNLLYLLHTVAVASAGLAGVVVMWRALWSLSGSGPTASRILCVWLVSMAVVGGEVAWALRPFVGSVYLTVAFVREDALNGNVYEFIWTDIRPHLVGRGTAEGDSDAR
jgi:hypothetical protein